MRDLIQVINEHYVNALTPEEMKKYADEVWKILVDSYDKAAGGIKGMKDVDQLIRECDMWKIVRKDGKIRAVKCYTFKRGGRKSCYCGTDGTPEGKEALYGIIKEDAKLKDRSSWAECSGKMEHIYIKYGFTPIPVDVIQKLMPDKQFKNVDEDGYHYERNIAGHFERKIMVANLAGLDLDKFEKQRQEWLKRHKG